MSQAFTASTDAIAAGAATVVELLEAPGTVEDTALTRIHFIPSATQAAQGATNFCTLNFRQLRGGTPVQTVGSINLSTTALAAETPVEVTPSVANAQFVTGDVIDMQAVHTGTGGAVPTAEVEVEFA